MSSEVIVEREGAVGRLIVNRPDVRNALSLAVTGQLVQAIRDLSRDRAIRVLVLTGAGDRVFVSGADVREFRQQLATPESALNYDAAAEQLQSALRETALPVIARIGGHAVGSGTIVAASCDFRIAVRTAKFGIPVAKFGFLAAVPDTLRLVQLVGTAKAKWLLMTGQLIEAPEAQAIGLIDQVVDEGELDAAVDALAATLASNAPLSIKAAKQIIETFGAPSLPVTAGAPWYAEIFRSADLREGLEAFFSKRKPEFKGE
jgi:enoyl-CoA hydratase